MRKPIRFDILNYPGSQQSAVWGVKDLLDHANVQAEGAGGRLFDVRLQDPPTRDCDVLLLPPALTLEPPKLLDGWSGTLGDLHKQGAMLASVCSGAFLLAQSGLLEGRRATTHWRHATLFRDRFPGVIVDTDQLLVDLGDVVTAGGVMAWTDLTLHLISRYGGRKLMLDIARMFVLDPLDREQRYYVSFVPNFSHADQQIAQVQQALQADIQTPHSVADLASRASMSERSFLRRFKQATGKTPVAYLQLLRVEAARSRLELTRDSFDKISRDVGYNDSAAFRRLFKRVLGLTPSDYRRRFGPAAPVGAAKHKAQ